MLFMFMKKFIAALCLFVSVFLLAACGEPEVEDPRLTEIAKCLTANGVKLYGTVWCNHCAAQKKSFGSSFEYIDYVECDPQTDLEGAKECLTAGIEGYPTWVFGEGDRVAGKIDPEVLAEEFNC